MTTIATGALFGLALASLDPAPFLVADYLFVVAFAGFVAVGLAVRSPRTHRALIAFGLITFGCFALTSTWYWYGAFHRGWWYPPQLPWLQLFRHIDGEASYDAEAANFFLSTWVATSAVFWLWFARQHDAFARAAA